MTSPQTIEAVLKGPHIRKLMRDGDVVFVEAEPLRFIPLSEIAGYCPRCGDVEPCGRRHGERRRG